MTQFPVTFILLWLLAILLVPISVVLLYVCEELKRLLLTEGLELGKSILGQKVPAVVVKDATSNVVRDIGAIYPRQRHLILVVSSGCGSCKRLLSQLNEHSHRDIIRARLIILCMGVPEHCVQAASHILSIPVLVHDLLSRTDEATDLWEVGFPALLMVDETGVVVGVRHLLTLKGIFLALEKFHLSDIVRSEESPVQVSVEQ